MRQYLYLFWGLVITGMVVMTIACPEFRRATAKTYSSNYSYAVYNENGERIFMCGIDLNAHMSGSGCHIGQCRF
jgi:hypothetical protein